jgi:hypothetical protein
MTRTVVAALLIMVALFAQSGTGPAGHWEGTIQTPNGDLNIQIDLAADPGKGWIGTISIPVQNTRGLAMIDLSVKENTVSFGIKAPGEPRFQATVAKEGGKMSGELMQGGANMPLQLTRTGEAKIEKPVVNPPLGKELEGTWEGTLDAGERQFRLRFILSNQAGAGTGVIFSLDQGNSEIPIARINQTGTKVKLEVPVIGGGFDGELKGTQLAGEWTQGGRGLPLTLTRAVK